MLKLNNLDVERFLVFSARPNIPSGQLIHGTAIDGVVQLDYSNIPTGYAIVGHDCYCDSTSDNGNFAYGSIASGSRFRFKRLANSYGFFVYAYAIKLN